MRHCDTTAALVAKATREIGAGQESGAMVLFGRRRGRLSIRTADVLAQIQRGDRSWVPAAVAQIIKAESLFGWRERSTA